MPWESLQVNKLFPSGYATRLMEYFVSRNKTESYIQDIRAYFKRVSKETHTRNIHVMQREGLVTYDGMKVYLTEKGKDKYFPA